MSEKNDGRKNKKYSNFKESRRHTILAKKDEEKTVLSRSSAASAPAPKILLKTKEKEIVETPIPAPQINIAIRDKTLANQSSKTTQLRELAVPAPAPVVIEPPPIQIAHHITKMKQPVDLITSNTINSGAFEFLNESNSLFLVVGVIGMRGVGKSTVLNLLTTLDPKVSMEEKVFNSRDGPFSSSSNTDGIQMFITKDRTVLLDCSPVISNLQKKDCVLNEIDDLKLIIFLLSVCHLVIVVQEDYVCTNLLRLIQNAEMMKINISKDGESDHLANIMFLKNYCSSSDFTAEAQEITNRMYKLFFEHSKLRIFPGNYSAKELKHNLKVNTFLLPTVDNNCEDVYYGHPKIAQLISEFRERVFMSPRNSMLKIQTPFSEKLWSQLMVTIWESHKNNFFLRKYESLKDKTNFHGHRDRENENGGLAGGKERDRAYYDY